MTETKTNCISMIRGVATLWRYHPIPAWHSESPREAPWTYSFSSGKRESKVDIHLPQCCMTLPWRLTGVPSHRNHWGNLQSSVTGNQIETEKGEELIETGFQIFVFYISACKSVQAEILASFSAHLQRQAGGPVWPGSSAGSSGWFGFSANGPVHSMIPPEQRSKFEDPPSTSRYVTSDSYTSEHINSCKCAPN